MPGTRLSNAERKLIKDWAGGGHRFPRLSCLIISGGGGLRGIRDLTLNLDRPITAICGPSGAGKSTLLELCALAFRPKDTPLPDQIGGAFDQQFATIGTEVPFSDFTLTWSYHEAGPITLQGATRGLSAPRPERPVIFVGAARLAQTRRRTADTGLVAAARPAPRPLEQGYVKRLSDVLRQPYSAVRWQPVATGELPLYEGMASYSGLNASLAEESLIEIFRQLFAAPTSALVIIEDIDAGLPPDISGRLASKLVDMCEEKSLQVILSARSPEFIDALPRQFRTLVEFDGATHHVQDQVPMGQLLRAIGITPPPDVLVFCEDDIAETIILQSVDGALRRRLKIIRAGSKSDLAAWAASHHRAGWGYKVLIVWDGDVDDREIRGWLKSLNLTQQEQLALSRTQLPGPLPPERWLVDQLRQHNGAALLADELNEDPRQILMLLNAAIAITQHHNIFFDMSRGSGLDPDKVLHGAIRAIRRLPHRPLDRLADQIARVAAGESVIEAGAPQGAP